MKLIAIGILCVFGTPLFAQLSPSVNTAPAAPQVQPPAVQAQQPPSYANYSIMLVGPPGGIAVVLMHNPKNGLEFVEVNNTKQALSAGYVRCVRPNLASSSAH